MEAQEKMKQRKNRKGANSAKHDYLLSGLIMCEHCGQAMTGSTSSKKGGPEYRYYRCPKKTRLGTHVCPNRSVPADQLEKLVIGQIQELFLDPDTLDELMDKVEVNYRQMLEKVETEIVNRRIGGLENLYFGQWGCIVIMTNNIDCVIIELYSLGSIDRYICFMFC